MLSEQQQQQHFRVRVHVVVVVIRHLDVNNSLNLDVNCASQRCTVETTEGAMAWWTRQEQQQQQQQQRVRVERHRRRCAQV